VLGSRAVSPPPGKASKSELQRLRHAASCGALPANPHAARHPSPQAQRSCAGPSSVLAVGSRHPVAQYLQSIGLHQYTDVLLRAGFDDLDILAEAQEAHLNALGLPAGHILKIQMKLRTKVPKTVSSSSTSKCWPEESIRLGHRQPPTERKRNIVRDTWRLLVQAHGDLLGAILLEAFVRRSPDLNDAFSGWPSPNGSKPTEIDSVVSAAAKSLLEALEAVLLHAADPTILHEALVQLGGVAPTHQQLPALEEALLSMVQQALGSLYAGELESAWTTFITESFAAASAGYETVVPAMPMTPPVPQQVGQSRPTTGRRDRTQPSNGDTVLSHRESLSGGTGEASGMLNLTAMGNNALVEGHEPLSPHDTRSALELSEQVGGTETPASSSSSSSKPPTLLEGHREVYQLEGRLQKAIFGDVFRASGRASGNRFAIKVIDLTGWKQEEQEQLCEKPLREVVFADHMRGLPHVVQLEDHFSHHSRHFLVFNLAAGGDLFELLKARAVGFPEDQVQDLIRQAACGLAGLHNRGLAMQDVSLENMLVDWESHRSRWHLRLCDPGQAVEIIVSPSGSEKEVPFAGFVGKPFRPPELYAKSTYFPTKVDSWCLGWCAFSLLLAQPLFVTADPAIGDSDFQLFQRGEISELFRSKGWHSSLSNEAADLILRLMQINAVDRFSCFEALRHRWVQGHQGGSEPCNLPSQGQRQQFQQQQLPLPPRKLTRPLPPKELQRQPQCQQQQPQQQQQPPRHVQKTPAHKLAGPTLDSRTQAALGPPPTLLGSRPPHQSNGGGDAVVMGVATKVSRCRK